MTNHPHPPAQNEPGQQDAIPGPRRNQAARERGAS